MIRTSLGGGDFRVTGWPARGIALAVAAGLAGAVLGGSQQPDAAAALTIEVTPAELTLEVGETVQLSTTVRDADGNAVDDAALVYYSRARRSVGVSREGLVRAMRPGTHTLVVLVPADRNDRSRRPEARVRAEVQVIVPQPPIAEVAFTDLPDRFYVGTRPRLDVTLTDTTGARRDDVRPAFSSADPAVAAIDRFGNLALRRPGMVDVTAAVDGVSDVVTIDVVTNPIAALELRASAEGGRTGDVIRFTAAATDESGREVDSVPIGFAVGGETASGIVASGAPAQIAADGRFVAERSGTYTVIATSGSHSAAATVAIEPRDVYREIEVVGRGRVLDRRSSDLWVWEGTDGRDYAITGTWGADGHSYFWDVTDPANIEKIQEVQVDARTVNDVKVSPDGEVAVIGREGASNRRNGIVVLGAGNPREGVPVLSEFTDQLTGGVHNVFVDGDHVYALSAGRRYDVISIEDPREPQRVGRFELDTPGHAVHDVWIQDGIAFSSNWADGVVAVDVGGGGRGGTPERPVELGRYAYPNGWNHAAFPYRSQSTGAFYLFAGDEAYPYGGLGTDDDGSDDEPFRTAGWIHVIEWSDWDNPREVARYQVPEAGTHNIWVEDDLMYVGFYYPGGLRVVDVSGELMGDLYRQGREVARFVPFDHEGFTPNAPFVWGPQPYKGHVFFTDYNSGLWAVRLMEKTGPAPVIGEPQ
ncbi:MAG: hypothetical protein F4Z04_12735 [Acidobacteria bacterium]|nr:hypothetical protein [Acidobacteriota bacterium]MYD72323.1 hypothetical protein [Acidobacteriota bacterium]